MWLHLASAVDALHALLMVAWTAGIPLLFWHRWPRVSLWYGRFAIVFIVLNQTSQWVLGECFLTTISRYLWSLGSADPHEVPQEWFTVRFAQAVFHLTPSHALVKRLTELLVLISAIGFVWTMRKSRRRARHAPPRGAAEA